MSIFGVAILSALLFIFVYLLVFFKLSKGWQRANWLLLALWATGAIVGAEDEYFLFILALTLLLMPLSILRVVLGETPTKKSPPKPALLPIDEQLRKAALLRLELKGAYLAEEISEIRYQALSEQIDQWIDTLCATWELRETRRRQLLDAAWQALQAQVDEALGDAPWQLVPSLVEANLSRVEEIDLDFELEHSEQPSSQSRITARPPHNPPPKPTAPNPTNASTSQVTARPQHQAPPQPTTPNPLYAKLKQQFKTFFSEFLWRFLWQNFVAKIGWFIGGFCFVSGTVFLVAYSSGYTKALAVLGTLSLYALLLFWGGYKIRRKREDLQVVSQVLLILGILLIPLIFATATRLLLHEHSLVLLSLLLSLLALGGAVFATRLTSGLMERALLQGHPSWFIALAAMQFFTPLTSLINHWYALAALHFVLLLLLGMALQQFTQHWLHKLFIEQRQLSYYAAGTLLYAAVVSFIHLTWSNNIALPVGYNGVFLMALSLLLFNVDRHLKQWVEKKAWLDRFSFVIYALSSVAVLAAWLPLPNLDAAVLPLAITLALAAVLYGLMLWHYLSLPPLYLLILAIAGEYALLLRPLPAETHFLLSLPGLIALLLLRRFLWQRKAHRVAPKVTQVLLGLLPVLVVWSLWQAQPSWTAMFTPLSAALLWYFAVGSQALRKHETLTQYCYLLSAFVCLTLAYAPLLLATWALQFSLALLLLSLLWGVATRWALAGRLKPCHANVFIDSSLLSLGAALGLAAYWLSMPHLSGWLGLAGGILFLQGLWFNSRIFIYAALLSSSAAALLFIEYYQIISNDSLVLSLGISCFFAAWYFLRRLDRARPFAPSSTDDAETGWTLRPLHLWELGSNAYRNRAEMLWQPLAHAMWVLWLLGLLKLGGHFLHTPAVDAPLYHLFGFSFPAAFALPYWLGAFLTLLIAGQYRIFSLLSLAQLLLTWSLLLFAAPWLQTEATHAANASFSLLIIGFNLCAWWSALYLAPRLGWLWRGLDWQAAVTEPQAASATAAKDAHSGLWQVEHVLHHTAFVLIALSLFLPLTQHGGLELLLSLLLAVVFWAQAGQRYQYPLHAYLVVGGVSLLLLSGYSLFADVRLWLYLDELELGWLLTGLSLGLALLGGWVSRFPAKDLPSLKLEVYQLPLYHLAYLLYALAIIATFPLYPWIKGLSHHSYSFSVLLLAQSLVLLPLLRSPAHPALVNDKLAAHLRGVLMPVLLSFALINLLVLWQLSERLSLYVLVGWAFVLWGWAFYPVWRTAHGDTPRPTSAAKLLLVRSIGTDPIAPQFAPWWGLLLIAGALFISLFELDLDIHTLDTLLGKLPTLLAVSLAPVIYGFFMLQAVDLLLLASLALYLVLLLQLHHIEALRWNAAVAVLLTGLLTVLKIFPLGLSLNPPLVLGVLGWLNLLLYLSKMDKARLFAPSFNARLIRPICRELGQLSIGLLILFLLALAVPTLILVAQATATGTAIHPPKWLTLGLSLLLSLSFVHLFYLLPRRFYAHWLIFAVSITLLLAGMAWLPLVLWLSVWLWLSLVVVMRLR